MIAFFLALSWTASPAEEGPELAAPMASPSTCPLALEEPPLPAEAPYEAMVAQKRREALGRFHGSPPQNPEFRAEMMLRLAEVYEEEGRYLYRAEKRSFRESCGQCVKASGCDPQGLTEDHAESRKYVESAIRLYKRVLHEHPQYTRADQAAFYLARALRDLGYPAEAARTLAYLVQTHPESVFAPDAYVLLGEYGEAIAAMEADAASRGRARGPTELEQGLERYRWILEKEPTAPDAPRYQYAIVEVYRAMGRQPEAQAEIERLQATYGPGSPWARANARDQAALQAAADLIQRASP